MSENVGKKLDDHSKEERCSDDVKKREKSLKDDEDVGNDRKNEAVNPVPSSEDQSKYITRDEDYFSVMINGSF